MSDLILLRHGESEWNAKNLFTGWVDVDLNEKGVDEAKKGAQLLKAEGQQATETVKASAAESADSVKEHQQRPDTSL